MDKNVDNLRKGAKIFFYVYLIVIKFTNNSNAYIILLGVYLKIKSFKKGNYE